ncbi:MAG: MerR family transcriptional regulator [Sphaerochaetaceae bacterium]|nr:MerR family transcriptional regulator [Sphaerochaetaceae bacterium]
MSPDNEKIHPIAVVQRRTGLSAHVLRKWEDRYALVTPDRSETGRRLYSENDIARLSLLSRALRTGRTIGQLATVPDERLIQYIEQDQNTIIPGAVSEAGIDSSSTTMSSKTTSSSSDDTAVMEAADRFLMHLLQYQDREMDMTLQESLRQLGRYAVIDQLIPLIMRKIGNAWQNGKLRISHEHLATFRLETFLVRIIDSITLPLHAPKAVSAVLEGQKHTLGTLAATVSSCSSGYRTQFLGEMLPAEEIASVVQTLDAKVLILSITYPFRTETLEQELQNLIRMMPTSTTIIAGGDAAVAYQQQHGASPIVITEDFVCLRKVLQNMYQRL